jgi:putative FmdB family regulatory protein
MPTYEYECKRCNCTFEETQRITDQPIKRCPRCSGVVSGGTGVVFKGGGWAADLYAKPVQSNDDSK